MRKRILRPSPYLLLSSSEYRETWQISRRSGARRPTQSVADPRHSIPSNSASLLSSFLAFVSSFFGARTECGWITKDIRVRKVVELKLIKINHFFVFPSALVISTTNAFLDLIQFSSPLQQTKSSIKKKSINKFVLPCSSRLEIHLIVFSWKSDKWL